MSQGKFEPEPNNNMMSNREESSTSSILTTMTTFVKVVHKMDDTILVPSRLLDMNPQSKDIPQAVVPIEQAAQGSADLYAFYHMLNAIKSELVQGPSSDEEEEEEEEEEKMESEESKDQSEQDEHSKQVAKAFRHHLKGLFGVLKQLTGTAKFLTSRYQEDIDLATSNTGPASLSSFTL